MKYATMGSTSPYAQPRTVTKERPRSVPRTSDRPRLEAENSRVGMQTLEHLTNGWDGYDGIAPSSVTRLNGWWALNAFMAAGHFPDVSPDSNGTICFDWEGESYNAHFQVGRSTFSMYIAGDGRPSEHFRGTVASGLGGELKHALAALSRAAGKDANHVNPTQRTLGRYVSDATRG